LTCLEIDAKPFGAGREEIRQALEPENIEARPIWTPNPELLLSLVLDGRHQLR
jgi:hypothetical protein